MLALLIILFTENVSSSLGFASWLRFLTCGVYDLGERENIRLKEEKHLNCNT